MTRRVLLIVVGFLLVLASACSSDTQSPQPPTEVAVTTTSMSTTIIPTTTAASTPANPADVALARLVELGYYNPDISQGVDYAVGYAVEAFQKAQGLERTGQLSDVLPALTIAERPTPPRIPTEWLPTTSEENARYQTLRIVVDVPRQIVFLVKNDAVVRIIPTSTGTGGCEGSVCWDTPTGHFKVLEKRLGDDPGILGVVRNSLYFSFDDTNEDYGVAIHGYPHIPIQPASHGCVRIPMHESEWLINQIALGTPVYVVG